MFLTNESVMRRKIKHALTLTLALSAIIVGFNQCEKGPEEFGQQVMHADDSISAKYDTSFVLNTKLVETDSFSTLYHFFSQSEFISNYSNVLLGGYTNQHFGTLKASFISQVEKTDSTNFAGDSLEAVGAELYFKINERYGSVSNAQIQLYKLNKELDITDPYYNTEEAENFYNPEDKISAYTDFLGDTAIKVTLTQDFADFLTTADDTTMADGGDFKEFFKGFYAEMEYPQDAGFLNKINLTNDTTRMELAVRKIGTEETPDTLTYRLTSSSIRFNMFEHDYETATYPDVNVNTYLNNDTSKNDSILLISGLGGPRAKLTIPKGVKEKFSQDSIFLARAEVQVKPITQFLNTSDIFFPDKVGIYTYSNDTSYLNISNSQLFNGEYNEDDNLYSCNITSFVQAYIEGQVGNTIYIQTNSYQTEPGQLIFSGTGNKQSIKLRIKYFKP